MDGAVPLLILADDFTGASDAAAPFAAGQRTLVVLSDADSLAESDPDQVGVLAVDLDLRECSDTQARTRTAAATRRLCSSFDGARVFLKIDSTLRGPIAGLVAGALSGSGARIAVIAPAFPEQGRFLHEGRLVLEGQPGASLTDMLGNETALVGARFAASPGDVEQAVEQARLRGARNVVVDADASASLGNVASAWRNHPDWLLVGSGGLARQVAGLSGGLRIAPVPTISGPILVVAGSPAPATAAQLECLRGRASFTIVAANVAAPLLPAPPRHLLVVCTRATAARDAGESAEAVADAVAEWSRSLFPGAVVLAGGATARRVCERLGAIGVELSGELSAGMPIGKLCGGIWHGVPAVTKAGGFGNPHALLDVVRALGAVSNQP